MIIQNDNFTNIDIIIPKLEGEEVEYLHILGTYDKRHESYFFPVFNKILDSLEFIETSDTPKELNLPKIDEFFKKADTLFNQKKYDIALKYYDKIFLQVPSHLGALNSLNTKGLIRKRTI